MFELPPFLCSLLSKDMSIAGPVFSYVAQIQTMLYENQLPFFPDYTDHGLRHISAVLASVEKLIPDQVKTQDVLQPADAAVIVCATLLHDAGMHLRESGFLSLIADEVDISPEHRSLWGDSQWSEAWNEYLDEAARFSDQMTASLYGRLPPTRESVRTPSDRFTEWDVYDRLLIGEFVRRHHPRLAYEFALTGIPGAGDKTALSRYLPDLAELCGIVARSHGIPIRAAIRVMRTLHGGAARPSNAFAPFAMGLLRVADYLQVGPERGPAVLLSLRDPASRVSVEEWKLQAGVAYMSYENKDPLAIHVQAASEVSHSTYFKLDSLIDGIQDEMDKTSAILSEEYGRYATEGFSQLQLAKTRISTNLLDDTFCRRLSFVPSLTTLSADPRLLSVIVDPLYAGHTRFAVRELIQNSVDAIKERVHATQAKRRDMVITMTLTPLAEDEWSFEFRDSGIGMTLSTIQRYFLRAGASFRFSPEWRREFEDEQGQSRVLRSGKFGVGVFSAFMLSNSIRVTTRHAKAQIAYNFDVRIEDEAVEVKKCTAPIGTTLSMRVNSRVATQLQRGFHDWYLFDWPQVEFVDSSEVDEDWEDVGRPGYEFSSGGVPDFDVPEDRLAEWRKIKPSGYDAVIWTSGDYPFMICNGIRISQPSGLGFEDGIYQWVDASMQSVFAVPRISVSDPNGLFPVSLRRDELIGGVLPFSGDVETDVCLDYIAFSMEVAPQKPLAKSALSDYGVMYPLVKLSDSLLTPAPLSFASCKEGIVPASPEFIQSLRPDYIAIVGAMGEALPDGKLSNVCPKNTVWIPHFICGGKAVHSNEPFYDLISRVSGIKRYMGIDVAGAVLYLTTPSHLQSATSPNREVITPNLLKQVNKVLVYEVDFEGTSIADEGVDDALCSVAGASSRRSSVTGASKVPAFLLLLKCRYPVAEKATSRLHELWRKIVGGDGILSYGKKRRIAHGSKRRTELLRRRWSASLKETGTEPLVIKMVFDE